MESSLPDIIEKREKVQKRATKLVVTIKKLHYEERLRRLKLPTLKYRRIRGDMTELYKIFMLKYNNDITLKTIGKCIQRQYDTRNHRFALQQSHILYDMRKFSFPNRIIPLWNSLPYYVVSSPTLNTFKARLNRFWENQEIRYNWKADILYTGSRSNVELMFLLLLYSDCTIFGVLYNGLDIHKGEGPRPASSDLHYYYYYCL